MKLLKFLAVLVILFTQFAWATQSVQITEQWIREAPPNAKVLAAFMIIDNQSAESQTLVAASSPDFERTEIHQTIEHDGMMHMEKQEQLVIESKQQLMLKPGSYHLMLMGIKRPLHAGDEVELTLKFANGEELVIKTPVRKSSLSKESTHNHH
ncbi:copper chaperone PCu(A)C [Candidatus Halobeggiatoa sp. HSG11]|nr:copper chaperone PCu(A)C [Candidatus Halobeggiatoa sp. HSG11]